MAISSKKIGNNIVVLNISERFDGSVYDEFAQQVRSHEAVSHYEVFLENLPAIDTCALGMLLLMREQECANDEDIVVHGLSDEMKHNLTMTNFAQRYRIKAA